MSGDARPAEPKAAAEPPRRRGRAVQVSRLLTALLSPAARARGFAEATILADWGSVVGPGLARRCRPVAVRFVRGSKGGGTLLLETSGPAALELQHAAPQIIERVNTFFGFPAVRALRFVPVQGWTPPARPRARAARPLGPERELELETSVAVIADPALRDVLVRLGRSIARASSGRRVGP
jgi:hypothetical protein